ncbi:Transcription factor btd like, partial [Olea europaea subsp. europaea]
MLLAIIMISLLLGTGPNANIIVSNMSPVVKANESVVQDKVKMSRRTKKCTPLLVKLLIAIFPFLGFRNKLL